MVLAHYEELADKMHEVVGSLNGFVERREIGKLQLQYLHRWVREPLEHGPFYGAHVQCISAYSYFSGASPAVLPLFHPLTRPYTHTIRSAAF